MNRQIFLEIAQVIISAGLIGLILLQARGVGLSSAFGGAGFATKRRGVERLVFFGALAMLFLLTLSSLALSFFK